MANRTPISSTKNILVKTVKKNPTKKSSKIEIKKVLKAQPKTNTKKSFNATKEKVKVNPKKLTDSKKEIKLKVRKDKTKIIPKISTTKEVKAIPKIVRKKEINIINKPSSNKIKTINKPSLEKDNSSKPTYPQDTIFLANYLKILNYHKVYVKDIDLIKLKKILPILDNIKKEDLIEQFYSDINATLDKMHNILEIPKETIIEDFHKCLLNPQVAEETITKPITLEVLNELKIKSSNQIRTTLCNYYNTVFLKIHKQVKLL
jgi:hypothetical protein